METAAIAQISSKPAKRILNEVVFIRLVLVLFLVLYHSFAPFSSSWKPLTDEFIGSYYWISRFSYSFFLGSFVFISGYLYMPSSQQGGGLSLLQVIKKKGRRLLVPSIIFSAIYVAIFGLRENETSLRAAYSILEGRGHMWFLPMLFWLFIAAELINHVNLKPKVVLPLTFLLAACVVLPLPLRLNSAFQYLIYFYLGYIIRNKQNEIAAYFRNNPRGG